MSHGGKLFTKRSVILRSGPIPRSATGSTAIRHVQNLLADRLLVGRLPAGCLLGRHDSARCCSTSNGGSSCTFPCCGRTAADRIRLLRNTLPMINYGKVEFFELAKTMTAIYAFVLSSEAFFSTTKDAHIDILNLAWRRPPVTRTHCSYMLEKIRICILMSCAWFYHTEMLKLRCST